MKLNTLYKRQNVLYSILAFAILLATTVNTYEFSRGKVSYMVQDVSKGDIKTVSKTHFSYEIVTTLADQKKGLGGRELIPQNYGMLFVLPPRNNYGFWMKDMLVPIDIIWLSDTGTITKIDEAISPDTYPKVFYPTEYARYVLETRANESTRQGWGVGSQILLPLPYGK